MKQSTNLGLTGAATVGVLLVGAGAGAGDGAGFPDNGGGALSAEDPPPPHEARTAVATATMDNLNGSDFIVAFLKVAGRRIKIAY
jgi:hypothetical protein